MVIKITFQELVHGQLEEGSWLCGVFRERLVKLTKAKILCESLKLTEPPFIDH